MTCKRMVALLAAGTLALGACSTADARTPNVGTSPTSVARDTGVADEPVSVRDADGTVRIVVLACDSPVNDAPAGLLDAGHLAEMCDQRVTGERCEEDAWCAVQEIAETGEYRP